jgi:hypothetical protein
VSCLKFPWRQLNRWDPIASRLHVQSISTAKYRPCTPVLSGHRRSTSSALSAQFQFSDRLLADALKGCC